MHCALRACDTTVVIRDAEYAAVAPHCVRVCLSMCFVCDLGVSWLFCRHLPTAYRDCGRAARCGRIDNACHCLPDLAASTSCAADVGSGNRGDVWPSAHVLFDR